MYRASPLTVRLAGPGPGAVLAGGLFAVSRLSWQWSMVAEVFALNNLFVGLLFFSTASFHCAENATQRQKVNLPLYVVVPSFGSPRTLAPHGRRSKTLDLFRLHTGERCAVAWGSATSTRCCCMCWSSFPGSFAVFTLSG